MLLYWLIKFFERYFRRDEILVFLFLLDIDILAIHFL